MDVAPTAPGGAVDVAPTAPGGVVDVVDDLTGLRAAVTYADSHPGPDTITFDPSAFGNAPRTIKLVGGPLVLTDPATVTIIGPGRNRLTLSGGAGAGSSTSRADRWRSRRANDHRRPGRRGGGILNESGTLALDHVVLRGNQPAPEAGCSTTARRH